MTTARWTVWSTSSRLWRLSALLGVFLALVGVIMFVDCLLGWALHFAEPEHSTAGAIKHLTVAGALASVTVMLAWLCLLRGGVIAWLWLWGMLWTVPLSLFAPLYTRQVYWPESWWLDNAIYLVAGAAVFLHQIWVIWNAVTIRKKPQ